MFDFIKKRLNEQSTWKGLILILTSLGVTLSPEQQNAIVSVGLGLVGLINTFFPSKDKIVADGKK
jgi:hypothetical protein